MSNGSTTAAAAASAKPRSVFLCSSQLGCPANLALTTQLHNYVAANQWTFASAAAADSIVVVACSILVEYRLSVVGTVRYLLEHYPGKQIVVAGCYVKEDVLEAPNLVYITMARKEDFDLLWNPTTPMRDISPVSTAEEDREVAGLRDSRAVLDRPCSVSVETGCLSRCAYCVERNLFPTVQSVPLAEVVRRCKEGLHKGYKNFLIGGTDVCSYGTDIGCDVTDLFAALFTEAFTGSGDVSVGFKALEPGRFIRNFPTLKTWFATRRIDWIYLPIESGSDRVLETMRRKYRVAEVLDTVAELRKLAPSLRVETDFVVCFPTETTEEFEASLKLLGHFDHCNLVVFNRHENTEAWSMQDEFSAEERARRCAVVDGICSSMVRTYRPECRTQIEVPLAAGGGSGLYVLDRQLADRPV